MSIVTVPECDVQMVCLWQRFFLRPTVKIGHGLHRFHVLSPLLIESLDPLQISEQNPPPPASPRQRTHFHTLLLQLFRLMNCYHTLLRYLWILRTMHAGLNGDSPRWWARGLCGSGPTLTILTPVSFTPVSLTQDVVLDRMCTLGL